VKPILALSFAYSLNPLQQVAMTLTCMHASVTPSRCGYALTLLRSATARRTTNLCLLV
jgi:hypothetical protein